MSIYDRDLDRNPANYVPLSPLSFLVRAAQVYGQRTAVIHGERRYSYAAMLDRCRRLAAALRAVGVSDGDSVAVLAPNVPELLEAHYGVPMAGAVLCALNFRLDPAGIGFILEHCEAKVLVVDRKFSALARAALDRLARRPLVVDIDDPLAVGGERIGATDYEAFLAGGRACDAHAGLADEWQAIALNYTSGTTGNPKGVVYHHRGAYLAACGNALAFHLTPQSVYLWTLPMFHCNGWSYTWAVTLVGGTHVCLRRPDAMQVFKAIADFGVTHLCAAPIVLGTLIHAPIEVRRRTGYPINIATGGSPPPSAVLARIEEMGFAVTHLYGLTESYGPATVCLWQPGLDSMPAEERAVFMTRQGVPLPTSDAAAVLDPATLRPVAADGATVGELMLRGNGLMKGYLKNPWATREAFADGWFHTGDLAVVHADGYVEIKDRSKDIIISGGENISSIEVEDVLYRHPSVIEAAVVARRDERWGETPHAFVLLRPEAADSLDAAAIIAWCRRHLAHFKCPRYVTFGPLPKTATGKVKKHDLRQSLNRASM